MEELFIFFVRSLLPVLFIFDLLLLYEFVSLSLGEGGLAEFLLEVEFILVFVFARGQQLGASGFFLSGQNSSAVKVPQLFDPVFGYFEQFVKLIDEAFLFEEEIMVQGKSRIPFVLVGISFPKEFLVDPFVEVQKFLPQLEQFLSQHGVLLDQLAHFPLVALKDKGILRLLGLA